MLWIFIFFLLIQLIVYPIVGIKLLRSIFKKDRVKIKKNSIWLVLILCFSGFTFDILPGSNYFWFPFEAAESKIYTKRLTGISFVLPEPIYELDSERAFNGDGTSIAIYKLDDAVIQKLLEPDSMFFSYYPENGIRGDWQTEKWTRTPLDSKHQNAFYFASLAANSSTYNLEELLNEPKNYYAFSYLIHSFSGREDHFGNIDFYLISPKRKLLVSINVNT